VIILGCEPAGSSWGLTRDCDPTTVYAALLEGRYTGVIHRSDLESPNLYNTYQHSGLPPGPIANPSWQRPTDRADTASPRRISTSKKRHRFRHRMETSNTFG
jgi:hypothetical protein